LQSDPSVKDVLAPNAAVFVWAIDETLDHVTSILESWGTKRVYPTLIWDKARAFSEGKVGRYRHEYLCVGLRGEAAPVWRPESIISVPRDGLIHSQKPAEFYEIIERMFPSFRQRLELFARREQPGWHGWGNHIAWKPRANFRLAAQDASRRVVSRRGGVGSAPERQAKPSATVRLGPVACHDSAPIEPPSACLEWRPQVATGARGGMVSGCTNGRRSARSRPTLRRIVLIRAGRADRALIEPCAPETRVKSAGRSWLTQRCSPDSMQPIVVRIIRIMSHRLPRNGAPPAGCAR
jgi:hypothetical protein